MRACDPGWAHRLLTEFLARLQLSGELLWEAKDRKVRKAKLLKSKLNR